MSFLTFTISTLLIIIAGSRLTVWVDRLSDQLHLGKLWIGIVLLGLVTSLPEAITCLVSVVSLNANDLAVGNILGSNNFNPILIVVMDVFYRSGSITNIVIPQKSHAVSALLAVALTLCVVVEIFLQTRYSIPVLLHVSIGSVIIAILYLGGMRWLAQLEAGGEEIVSSQGNVSEGSITKTVTNIIFCAVVVIVAAFFLAGSADQLAQQTGLGQTFVGSIFLALVTSLPELVVSLSAMRLNSYDLAIGNIFGSNMGNVFILFLCDIVYFNGALLNNVSETHILTGLLSVALTLLAIWGIFKKDKKVIGGLGFDSVLMITLFGCGTAVLYHLR